MSTSHTSETIGKRIARLRQINGMTQQSLAARLAISRVAISHIEMDLSIPSERTITLIAGLFKLTPHALVEDTTYPVAKAERLPAMTLSYSQLEMDLALLDNDLGWLKQINGKLNGSSIKAVIWQKWEERLTSWAEESLDDQEREWIAAARLRLAAACER